MGVIYNRHFVDRQTKDDRKLINYVTSHPVLYDRSHASYCNRSERQRIWEFIAKSLKSTAANCEERWNKLVEMYRSNTFNRHFDLMEKMNQILEVKNESIDLSAEESVEQISIEEILIVPTYASLPPHTRSFTRSRHRADSRRSRSFFSI